MCNAARAVVVQVFVLCSAVTVSDADRLSDAAPADPPVSARKAAHERGRAEGMRLLSAGDVDAALSAMGAWGTEIGEALLRRAGEAKTRGDAKAARELYGQYFAYYPFGYLYWHHDSRVWSAAAFDYLNLRRAAGATDEATRLDAGAEDLYRQLMARYDGGGTHAERAALADRIVAEHPGSLFCPAAVLSVGHAAAENRGGICPQPEALYQHFLDGMKRAGAPERSQILVMLAHAGHVAAYGDSKVARDGLALYQEVGRRTNITYEKRYALLQSAKLALTAGGHDSLAQSRELFAQFLARYPEAFEGEEARLGIVNAHLAEGRTDEASEALRDLAKSAPAGADLAPASFAISKAHFAAGRYARSLEVLEEIARRYPASPTASQAAIGMGEVYEKLGDEEQMVAAYERAAGMAPADTNTNVMDASNTANRAFEFLGRHYMKKGKWEQALRWWQGWRPGSWCGTCSESMEALRVRSIATCLLKLGREQEALQVMEPSVFGDGLWPDPSIAVMTVDVHRRRGQLDAFEAKAKAAAGQSKYASGPSLALAYIELLRLAERKDVAGLWKHLNGKPPSDRDAADWKSERASRLLAAMPAVAKPVALAKSAEPGEAGRWACIVLARMKADEVIEVVERRTAVEENFWALGEWCHVLTELGTPAAREALNRMAASTDNPNRMVVARKALKKFPLEPATAGPGPAR